MKKIIFFITLLTIIVGGCKQKSRNPAEETLREFYTQYITECAGNYNSDVINNIMAKFVTKELTQKLKTLELDYDPFLNAQDCDTTWLKTLEINPVQGPGMDDAYRICYDYDGVNTVCLTLFLVQIDGKWLINEIESLSESPLQTPEFISCDAMPETLTINANGTFISSIRPSEKLQLGKIYTDIFEYVDYDDQGDDLALVVKKDTSVFPLIANELFGELNGWARGDLYQIEWKIDTMRPAGDSEALWIEYFAEKTTKIKDGNVSLFRKKHTEPLKFTYSKEGGYTSYALDWIYRTIEYYLANSKQKLVIELLNDPNAEISYSIEEDSEERGIRIGISNTFENHTNTIQWIYMIGAKIYEYDLPNDKLIEFKE